MATSTLSRKPKMTDEERLALAAKLDGELHEFINGLEKKRYEDGWPEDRWEEEMEKHPFFMKSPPKEGDELHPLMEGMQQLKYDPIENTNEDLANTYKEDGNFYIKHKKYRMAIFSYTEGLNMKCENLELVSILYNNRSAAHYYLENYRTSMEDANRALKINPKYTKAKIRLANCLFSIGKFDECLLKCDEILQSNPKDQSILDLRKQAQQSKSNKTRDERKRMVIEKKKSNQIDQILQTIGMRKIQFGEQQNGDDKITQDMLIPRLAPLEDHPVHLDENGALVWPAAFCYPEFLFSDFQQNLSENVVMIDILSDMFAERLECDKKHEYKPNTLNVYFENHLIGIRFKINVQLTIRQILTHKSFLVSGGCLTFYIVPANSEAEKKYLSTKVLIASGRSL